MLQCALAAKQYAHAKTEHTLEVALAVKEYLNA